MSEWTDVIGTAAGRPGQEAGKGNEKDATQAAAQGPDSSGAVPSRAQRPAVDKLTASIPLTSGKTLVAVLTLYCLSVASIFHETLVSMVEIWIRSETFAHGFLILPISLWLAWRRRDRFSGLTVRPQPLALLLVLAAGLAWLLANLVDVLVVQQLAFVAVLISGIWAIAGTAVLRCYAFPLGFLFLAVPMGEELIPPLMVFTADTTEFLVRASGVPIFRDGMYLFLPTGTWSVIEACSGVRYLIASVTLGLCYAHLTYNSLWRQVAFVALAIVAPILANSARAYVLVMVGHLSDMRYGIGADHLLFGWVFFGVLMLLMFWIGGFWQQQEEPAPASGTATSAQDLPALSLTVVTVLALFCASVWPAAAFTMNRNNGLIDAVPLTIPVAADTWQTVDGADWRWHPAQPGADRELDQVYATGNTDEPAIVGLHLRQYLQQEQDAELIETTNPWRPDRNVWRVIEQQSTLVDLDRPVQVAEARVVSARDTLLVWSWYRVDDYNTANPYLVKLLEAKQQVIEGRRRGTRLFIATPVVGDRMQARAVLQKFVTANLEAIEASLDSGLAGGEPLQDGAAE